MGFYGGRTGRPAVFLAAVFAVCTVFEDRDAAFFCEADAAFTADISAFPFPVLCAVLDDPVRAMICLSLVYALSHALFVYVLQGSCSSRMPVSPASPADTPAAGRQMMPARSAYVRVRGRQRCSLRSVTIYFLLFIVRVCKLEMKRVIRIRPHCSYLFIREPYPCHSKPAGAA